MGEHRTKSEVQRLADREAYLATKSTRASRRKPVTSPQSKAMKPRRRSDHRDVIAAMMQMPAPRSKNGKRDAAASKARNRARQ